jgi:hypothetical protein
MIATRHLVSTRAPVEMAPVLNSRSASVKWMALQS